MGRDEQIQVLEEMICLFEKAMEGLKSAYEATEDEKRRKALEDGIQTLGGAAALIRCQLQKILIEKELIKREDT